MSPRRRHPMHQLTHRCECGAMVGLRESVVRRDGEYVKVKDWRDDDNWRLCYAEWPAPRLRKHEPGRALAQPLRPPVAA